ATEIYHLREPQKIPQVMSPDEARRLLAVAYSLKARVLLSLCYGGGLRAGEAVRLKVKHIDSTQRIIRIAQSKRPKDCNVIQALLGHDKLDTTARYTRVATGMIASIESPLDLLAQPRKKPRKHRKDQPPA